MSTMVPHGLHLDYDLDFQARRIDDVAPTLTSPLLPSLIGNIRQLERPGIPGEPASFKADQDLENEPPGQGESPQDQPPLEPDQPEITEIIISEGDESDITIEEPEGSSTPRSELASSQK